MNRGEPGFQLPIMFPGPYFHRKALPMFVVKHVVIAEINPDAKGTKGYAEAAFAAIGKDFDTDLANYNRHGVTHNGTTYEFPHPENGTISIDVGVLTPETQHPDDYVETPGRRVK